MELFIRGGFRALMDERKRQEKLELEASDKLPRELIELVLEYTHVSDRCLNRDNFTGRQFNMYGIAITNICVTAMFGIHPSIIIKCDIKKDNDSSVYPGFNDALLTDWMVFEYSLVHLLEIYVSRDLIGVIGNQIRSLYNSREITEYSISYLGHALFGLIEILIME